MIYIDPYSIEPVFNSCGIEPVFNGCAVTEYKVVDWNWVVWFVGSYSECKEWIEEATKTKSYTFTTTEKIYTLTYENTETD